MAIVRPQYDSNLTAGGLMSKLFDNLPSRFNPDPKPQDVLQLTPAVSGTPLYPLMSVQNGFMYFHTLPLNTVGYTPEVAYDLSKFSMQGLAQLFTQGSYPHTTHSYGYSASVIGVPDGTKALTLLGFTDFPYTGADTVILQAMTSRVWKFLLPIAKSLYEAQGQGDNAELNLYMPFSGGFWLDYWGDRVGVPRLPGMTDTQYVPYLMWSLRVPRSNNMAMEDILLARYQVPANVVDNGTNAFLVNFDASLMASISTDSLTPVINKIKPAGTTWNYGYVSSFSENYEASVTGRTGIPYRTSDKISVSMNVGFSSTYATDRPQRTDALAMGLSMPLSDTSKSRYNTGGIAMFGTTGGNLQAPFNDSGFYSGQRDTIFMYFNSPTDPSAQIIP